MLTLAGPLLALASAFIAGPGVHYLPGDVDGDGKTDIIETLDSFDSRLGLALYLSDGVGYQLSWRSLDMGAGPGAIEWLVADFDGDRKAELLQLWDNKGRLGAILYKYDGVGLATVLSRLDIGTSSGSFRAMDVNGDGRAEIVQMLANGSRLGLTELAFDGNTIAPVWSNPDLGEGPWAVAWLVGDVNGDGRQDLIQLWDHSGTLGAIIYQSAGVGFTKSWRTDGFRAGSGGLFFVGDVNGDNRADVVQLWDNKGRLGVISYLSDGSKLVLTWMTSDVGGGSGALGWITGNISSPDRMDIAQLWRSGDRLAVTIYQAGASPGSYFRAPRDFVSNEGTTAVAFLPADVNADGRRDIVHLWYGTSNESPQARLNGIIYSPAFSYFASNQFYYESWQAPIPDGPAIPVSCFRSTHKSSRCGYFGYCVCVGSCLCAGPTDLRNYLPKLFCGDPGGWRARIENQCDLDTFDIEILDPALCPTCH